MLPCWIGIFLSTFSLVSSLIIPEELPSLLSLLYSNIPPVKKGTDSRVGFGFRLGPHADFQVLLEVGPQTNTGGIGPNAQSSGKRETLQMENTDKLVKMINTGNWKPQDQYDNELEEVGDSSGFENAVNDVAEKPVSNTDGGKWIDSWKNNFAQESFFGKIKFKQVPGIDSRSDRRKKQRPSYRQRKPEAKQPIFAERRQQNFVDHLQRLWIRNA